LQVRLNMKRSFNEGLELSPKKEPKN
jgi:hypothetical protein